MNSKTLIASLALVAGIAGITPIVQAAQTSSEPAVQSPTSDRQLKLSPNTPEALRDRGLAYRELGYARGARDDLSRYLQLAPEADDVEAMRLALIDLGATPSRLN